jgi:calcineurin-like phosphoesterase family protein
LSNVWFCSDLHLGHKRIGEFRSPFISSEKENRERILTEWNTYVTKRDIVYVLGDFCFDIEIFDTLNKELVKTPRILIRGNHDRFQTTKYLQFFDEVEGLVKYKGMWLSHSPIHPDELRGKPNVHGHVHFNTLEDKRYFNCCPENTWSKYGRCLISLNELRTYFS